MNCVCVVEEEEEVEEDLPIKTVCKTLQFILLIILYKIYYATNGACDKVETKCGTGRTMRDLVGVVNKV